MYITAIKTHRISQNENLLGILDKYIPTLAEKTVVAFTSKIVALCEGNVVPIEKTDKDKLIQQESQWYISRGESKYNASITITKGSLMAASGIDESNANSNYILLPKNPQESANKIRLFLKEKFQLKKLGVILTDSRTLPMRWGSVGVCVSFSGFVPINDYVGQKDLFGRELHITKVDVIDSLASACVYEMGETIEQMPLSLITDIPYIQFVDRNPTKGEIALFHTQKEDDLYAPILTKANWKKGKGK